MAALAFLAATCSLILSASLPVSTMEPSLDLQGTGRGTTCHRKTRRADEVILACQTFIIPPL
jgi:hypothetical protein